MTERSKLLVIAPGVTKDDVGEVLLAYKWLDGFANHYDVTLLTMAIKGRNTISEGELPIKIVCLKDYGSIPGQERINSMLKPWYPMFYVQARRWLKQHGAEFDWIHQLNPFAMRYPCPANGLGLNYSLGPLAGGVDTPTQFEAEMGGVPWFVKLRGLDAWRAKRDPWLRASFLDAKQIFVAASYVADTLRNRYAGLGARLDVESEHGVSELFGRDGTFMPNGKLRLLYVGRVIRTKGVRDTIRALAHLSDIDFEYTVVGAGEDLDECVKEADKLGLTDRVKFVGRRPHSEIKSYYLNSDIMVFPSFREASGGVVIEAMQAGLPQVVTKRGGPADLVGSEFGVAIPVTDPDRFARDIGEAIRSIATPEKLAELSSAAYRQCESEFFWKPKFDRITAIIDQGIQKHGLTVSIRDNSSQLNERGAV